MDKNRKLGLYVSYYLSRFDEEAYCSLGFGNQLETHKKIGELLSFKPQTIKNWRDEFDPLFGHRAGWYQRPMSPSRLRVVQALQDLGHYEVREIVRDILSGKIGEEPGSEEELLSIVLDERKDSSRYQFILRAPTGRAAEEFFINHYDQSQRPISGNLIDCRDLGVGYDFRIETAVQSYFVEVKGLSDFTGGVLFTNKEWATAKEHGKRYFLCLISNIKENPKIVFVQNPAEKLNPKKTIYTSIQVSWSVTQDQLAKLND